MSSTQLASSTSPTPTAATPRWDSRNSGFVSPRALKQLQSEPKQFSSVQRQPSPLAEPMPTTAPRPAPAERHSRSSSFFSFRNRQQQSQIAPGNNIERRTSLVSPPPSSSTTTDSGRSSMSRLTSTTSTASAPQAANGAPLNRSTSGPSTPQGQPPQLHPEIRSVVGLTVAHAHKVYMSGKLVRKTERNTDGQKLTKDDWHEVWAQLGGTTLSIWDMQAIQEANSQGTEVPPTYVNITDAFVSVLGSITVPETGKRYNNVLTLNTAGSNLLLFSCPTSDELISWASALRLSAWEKSRLEEIYTAHLIRITLSSRDIPTTLVRGRMEGWARVRLAGQTDWKRVWMVVSAAHDPEIGPTSAASIGATPSLGHKKKRISALFTTREASPPRTGPLKANVSVYLSPKSKDRKIPLLTMTDVTQAFAVYPERPELISRSTLIKLEGRMGTEDLAGGMRGREGWLLIMPELEAGMSQAAEMLKWVVSFHDAFTLYGRPDAWTWDPREPTSLMFAYPVGPQKDLLFLDRVMAEILDPREDGTSTIRSRLLDILFDRMRGIQAPPPAAPSGPSSSKSNGFQLPPLSFDNVHPSQQERHLLTPITEKSSVLTHGRAMSIDTQSVLGYRQSLQQHYSPVAEEAPAPATSFDAQQHPASFVESPVDINHGSGLPQSTRSLTGSLASSPPPDAQRSGSFTSSPRPDAASTARTASMDEPKISPTPRPLQTPVAFLNSETSSTSSLTSSPPPPMDQRLPSMADSVHSPASVLTSPFSIAAHSVLTSPYSHDEEHTDKPLPQLASPRMQESPRQTRSPPVQAPQLTAPATAPSGASADEHLSLGNEAGALYFMQLGNSPVTPTGPQPPVTAPVHDLDNRARSRQSTIPSVPSPHSTPPPRRQGTPMAFTTTPTPERDALTPSPQPVSPAERPSPRQALLGRKPSGARAPANKTSSFYSPQHVQSLDEEPSEDDDEDDMEDDDLKKRSQVSPIADEDLDALAALSYLQVEEHPEPPPVRPLAVKQPLATPPPSSSEPVAPYKSSFAPSKQAAERKARAEAKEAAQQAAAHRPGRANGRKKKSTGWNDSSDEEEEDEEEEDDDEDDADSDREPSIAPPKASASVDSHHTFPQSQAPRSTQGHDDYQLPQQQYSHQRPPRTLPQIPGRMQPEYDEPAPPQPPFARQRVNSNVRSEIRSEARYTSYDNATEYGQPPSHAPSNPSNPRQNNVWSQVLDPGAQVQVNTDRDTFIQLEPESQTMTKAFTPQGLLSAGMQDKTDRSAKRQEEIARETGASLVNVPHKPPPPQTGLLGAITAHERDRKREGGVGAALTEREREKRLAEERQRRFDEQQRQQMEQMQGSMYGGFNPMMGGMSPMMTGFNGFNGQGMNPMMTGNGINPMMTGNGMNPMMSGFPGMFNPQQMYAAQQAAAQQAAAMAYQQAMMSFSVAGSQAGGEGGQQQQPLNPMMTGMSGFDPRMSMFGGMGMGMGPMGMGMGGMGMGGMGMGGMAGSPMMGNMPPGAGQFDARFAPSGTPSPGELLPPNVLTGSPKLNATGSRTASPVQRGSPLVRAVDVPNSSRPTTPKVT